MKLSILRDYKIQDWWLNFIGGLSLDVNIGGIQYLETVNLALFPYGGSFSEPYMDIEFANEVNCAWFLLRFS